MTKVVGKNPGDGILAVVVSLGGRRPGHGRAGPRLRSTIVILEVRYTSLGRIAPVPLDDGAPARHFPLDIELGLALDGVGIDGFQRHGPVLDRGAVDEINQLGQDVHFEFQLDAVKQNLEAFLVQLHVPELHD